MNRRDFVLGNAMGPAVGAVGGYTGRAFGSTTLQRDLPNARADRTSAERELAKAQDELAKLGSARRDTFSGRLAVALGCVGGSKGKDSDKEKLKPYILESPPADMPHRIDINFENKVHLIGATTGSCSVPIDGRRASTTSTSRRGSCPTG